MPLRSVMLDLTIGVPLYRSAAFLPELCTRLAALDPAPRRVVLLDDASPDDSAALAQAFVDTCRGATAWQLLRNKDNLGIAGSYNRLVRSADTTWVQILDADDFPTRSDFFAPLQPHMQLPHVGCVVSGITSNSRALLLGNRLFAGFVPSSPPPWLPLLGSFATRSGVLYRRRLLESEAFIDPAFPGSDVIHFLRLRRHMGCRFEPKSRVFYRVHDGAQSSMHRDESRFLAALAEFNWPTRVMARADLALRRAGQRWSRGANPSSKTT